ncbi:CoA-disulfide reductase [Endozoicomonas montiporae]|uniref:CoA-disulfide reductase n=2 Tax=Endozoicomonas montiporae TaxID=1027273 RepID=A0A081N9R0_9GAMM|nr:CoA-disulfide reductase [Endozoicomonas montiporae]AMO55037.1 coenzyme A disulfide reductase [Endozoicomonas montiporae CL-33]KEQ15183.1 CoA-disulfide reductase [Endozoicomonas montiporae]
MKIVIIGAEAAGMSAAAKARRTDRSAEIVVLEQSDIVSFGACGLPYFVGGYFDDASFMAERSADQFVQSGIDLRVRHRVEKVDANNKTLHVRNLENSDVYVEDYDRLMIATGASAIRPPIGNLELGNVFFLKTMADGYGLKEAVLDDRVQNVVVVGAGYIGLEVVEAMKERGKRVRLIELSDRVVKESFDPEISELIADEIREQGIELHLQESVISLQGDNKVTGLVTDKGEYKADLVIVCTGVLPNTQFLKDTGINMLPNGALVIDDQARTSLPDIYAAGDCATVYHRIRQEQVFIPLATTANKLGRMLGENLTGAEKVFPGTLGSAAVKALDIEAGRTGISEADAKTAGLDYKTVVINDKSHTNYYPGQSDLRVKLIYERDSNKILGGQLVGKRGAVLRVDALAAAIHSGMTTEELGMLDLCYAPPFARTWDPLNVAGNVAK